MNRTILRTMAAIARDYWLVLAAIMIVGISQSFVGMYALVFFQRLIDGIPSAKQLTDLTPALAGYISLTVLNHVLIYAVGYPNSVLEKGVVQWVKLRALRKVSRIDYLAYQNLGTGNLIQNIENGAEATRNLLTEFYLAIGRQILPAMVISLFFIHYYDQNLFLIILASYSIFYLVSYKLMHYLRLETEKMLSNQEDFSRFSVRAFMELVVFRINGRFKDEIERVKNISDEVVRSRAMIYLVQELFFTGFALMIFIVQALVILQQVSKIIAGSSTIGTMVALVDFIRIVFFPISGLSMAWVSYRLNSVTFARFHSFFSLPDDPGLDHSQMINIQQGEVNFKQVSFAYPEQPVLHDFSLRIPGGKTTGLVGLSGSGKSTLVRLLLQLIKPQAGQVCIDHQDLSEINLPTYYQQVAYIPQEPPIFDGSLRENLVFDRDPGGQRLAEVIQQVGLSELVARLSQGLNTLVGERGVKLSGGERQRLAFGRLLLQDPKIVILDEPTSALDSLTEDFVTHNLIPFLKGKTVIVVAHRLQTVMNADQIVVLENGKVIQTGGFEELITEAGKFRQLWEKQANQQSSTTKPVKAE